MQSLLANIILIVHFLYVGFVVAGFLYIWVGYFLHWKNIYNPYFRWSHLGAMGIVVLEMLLGIFCPLTEWESRLRVAAGESPYSPEGFIPYWLNRLLYYDWPPWVFYVLYLAFFALLLLTFWRIPPRKKQKIMQERHF